MTTNGVWTPEQDAIVKAHYIALGGRKALALVNAAGPERTLGAVQRRASELGAARDKRDYRYGSSPHIDRRIRELFADTSRPKGAVVKLAAACNRPAWWITNRADALGIDRQVVSYKTELYSEKERAIIKHNAHLQAPDIARILKNNGFKRSIVSVQSYIKLHRPTNDREAPMTANQVARLVGATADTVCRWINTGLLPASRAAPHDGDPALQRFMIEPADIAFFFVHNPAVVNLGRVDRFWFIDLMANYGRKALGKAPSAIDRAIAAARVRPGINAEELSKILGGSIQDAEKHLREIRRRFKDNDARRSREFARAA